MRVKRPRIGLYKSFMADIDEGWTRWLLEQFGFAYSSLRNADVQAGGLRARFDSLVIADERPDAIENGYGPDAMPAEFTGGLGAKGAQALREFARAGGTLIFLNRAAEYGIAKLGLKAKNVVGGLPPQDFYSPGSLLNVRLNLRDPITLGLPEEIAIWSESSPAWETDEPAVARYPEGGILASGWLFGEKHIAGAVGADSR